MNLCRAISTTATRIRRTAVPRLVVSVAGTLGLMLAAPTARGQDLIRIVETPRTANRESRSVSPQPAHRAVPPPPGVVSGGTSVVYAEHFVTEMQDQYRTVYVPIIERQTVPTPTWWNPLGFSVRTFRPRPVVRWEPRVEKTRVPVRYRELVPETTALRQPTRTSASPIGSTSTAAVGNWTGAATRSRRAGTKSTRTVVLSEPPFDGSSRFESDQPRNGTRPSLRNHRAIR